MPTRNPRLNFLEQIRAPDQSKQSRFGALSAPPTRADVAEQAAFQRIVYPPRIEKLLSSQDFSVQDYAMILGAGAGSTITSANLRFQLPQSMVGWLQQFSMYVLAPLGTTNIQFTIRINEGPVSGFDNKQPPPGAANLIQVDFNELRIRIPNGAKVDVLVTNLSAAGPWTVGGVLAGWYHPQADELRIFGDQY
jgi:hypothetical protein